MKKIYFSSAEDAYELSDLLHTYNGKLQWQLKKHKRWGYCITFKNERFRDMHLEKIAICLAHLYRSSYLLKAIEKTIQSLYYYTDAAEINRILQIADDLLKREDDAIPETVTAIQLQDELQKIFIKQLHKTNLIYFDSILKFCLDPIKNRLINLVGIAIDDFKREEEQQNFLHSLRQYVAQRESTYGTIHLLHNKYFKFFTNEGEQISEEFCLNLAKQVPLYLFNLEKQEKTLGPLIAISPKRIFIYGEILSEPIILTVMNIFQERVMFKSRDEFPFV